ncbi:MAG: zinc-binding dehydrogenase [Chitinophagaceae bacterium]|nr:zinc-binding dehydrogenase [Chitinophagaceae bacterium]
MTKNTNASHVVFTAPLQVEILDRNIQRDLAPNEIMVRTTRTLISTGTELTVLRGKHTPGSVWHKLFEYPWDAGYCNVGIVLEVGSAVTEFRKGDRVSSTGPHATVFIISENDALLINDGVSDDEAAFATIAQIVMQGIRLADIKLGENSVVCGLGLLGQFTVGLARHVGAWPVIGVDLEEFRREKALHMGASIVAGPNEMSGIIAKSTNDRMADVVFEVTGSPQVIPTALEWVRRLGRFVMVSSPSGPTTVDFHDQVNAKGTVIIGAHNYTHASVPNEYNRWTRKVDTQYYLQLVEAGLFTAQKLITHRFSWDDAPKAYEQLLNDRSSTLGVILEWN